MTVPIVAAMTNGVINSVTNANNYDTPGNITAPVGGVILIFVDNTKTGGGDQPTASGLSGTWTVPANGSLVVGVYRFTLLLGTGCTGVGLVNIAYGGVTQNNCHAHFVGITDADNVNPLVQVVNNNGVGTAIALTLATFAHADNATVMGSIANSPSTTIAPEAGGLWAELNDTQNNDAIGTRSNVETAWKAGNDTSPTATISASQTWASIAAELKGLQTVTILPSPEVMPFAIAAPTFAMSLALLPSPESVPFTTPVAAFDVSTDTIFTPTPESMPFAIAAPSMSFGDLALAPTPESMPFGIVAPTFALELALTPSPEVMPLVTVAPVFAMDLALTPSPESMPMAPVAPTMTLSLDVAPTPVRVTFALATMILVAPTSMAPTPVAVLFTVVIPGFTAAGTIRVGNLSARVNRPPDIGFARRVYNGA